MEIKELEKRIINLEKENERRFIENKEMLRILSTMSVAITKILKPPIAKINKP